MRRKKVLLTSTLILIICVTCIFTVFAHKGRTDSNGGHRDNDNQSGLGNYHFHCGGYPAHLHENGVCPYTSSNQSASNPSSKASIFLQKKAEERDKEVGSYYEGFNDGYDKGYDKGYDEGYSEGFKEAEKETALLITPIFVVVAIVLLVKFIKKHRQ